MQRRQEVDVPTWQAQKGAAQLWPSCSSAGPRKALHSGRVAKRVGWCGQQGDGAAQRRARLGGHLANTVKSMTGAGSQLSGLPGEQGADHGPAGTLRSLGDRGQVTFISTLPRTLWTCSGGVGVGAGYLEPGEMVREDPMWVRGRGMRRNGVGRCWQWGGLPPLTTQDHSPPSKVLLFQPLAHTNADKKSVVCITQVLAGAGCHVTSWPWGRI